MSAVPPERERTAHVFEALHDARWRAVGARFLRHRPWIALLGALGNAAIATGSSAPRSQVIAVGALTASLVVAFAIEALALTRRALGARWLAISLVTTALAIGAGCALGGGLESPMLPLLFAPITVGLAAFGRGRPSIVIAIAGVSILAALAVTPLPFGPFPSPHRGWMTGWSTIAALALSALGITGLVEAHRSVGRSLDRMRSEAIEEAARRARDQESLGAKVAHEIRNPLTAVKGLVQMIAKGEREERDARRIEVILGEVERVERTLEDYLSLARPLPDLAITPVRARALVEEVAEIVEGRASARGVRVTCSGDGAIEVLADPRRLREALLNLAQNALEARGTTLALSVDRDRARVVLAVRDDGEGIPPEILARAGTPFVSGREGGTGLGLAHARSVARQHGGELEIESERGGGTIARVVLPAAPGGEEAGL